ncbi:hypothetical protein Asera_07920 [Actinocatenispora sera]|uniref:Tyr recombinase domain-containing protein n=1 Tax=Actinocatenispora sera TaxID=390989 RepID=A0A810KUH9_9ACTN|nr:hypothetical protein Asera_07920 [Actinocatenispora sera]
MRHGTATLTLAAGIEIRTVSAMLRHSSIAVTGLYSSVTTGLAHEAAPTINDAPRARWRGRHGRRTAPQQQR